MLGKDESVRTELIWVDVDLGERKLASVSTHKVIQDGEVVAVANQWMDVTPKNEGLVLRI